MNPAFNIQNKIALVTGANRGIGKAITDTLIEHGVGKVYAGVRRMDNANVLVEDYGSVIEPLLIDLTEPETIHAAARSARDAELVVNNAGVLTLTNVLDEHAVKALRFEFETNVLGLLHMAQAFAQGLIEHKGAFVQVNSVASVRAVPFIGTYSASKAAAYSIIQSVWQALHDQGVSVVSVHPGPIATDMADQAGITDTAEPPSVVAEAIVKALKDGEFHAFPDSLSKKVYEKYRPFAQSIIENNV